MFYQSKKAAKVMFYQYKLIIYWAVAMSFHHSNLLH